MGLDMDALKYVIEEARTGTRFKVIGVGGGGCNAVARMMQEGVGGVEFFAMNTDLQALSACPVPNKMQLGARITNGLGTGSNPDLGRQAALENTDSIVEMLQDADMVFITAGLGGGTGTGAAPVIASLAKELDALVVAVVTKPFGFEGPRRMKLAEEGLSRLAGTVDTVIAVPNDRLLDLVPRGTSIVDGFRAADDVLRQTVQGISDIILTPGLINRDFADIKATMVGMGYAMMGTATAEGEGAAVVAARQAISSTLMEHAQIEGARAVLINITGSSRLGLHDVTEACAAVREAAKSDVQINFGVILNEGMGDAVKVTVIAAGCQGLAAHVPEPEPVGVIRIQYTPAPPEPEPVEEIEEEEVMVAAEPEPEPVFEPEPVMMMAAAEPEPEPEPAMLAAEMDPIMDMDVDDLDTPAYLRQQGVLH